MNPNHCTVTIIAETSVLLLFVSHEYEVIGMYGAQERSSVEPKYDEVYDVVDGRVEHAQRSVYIKPRASN